VPQVGKNGPAPQLQRWSDVVTLQWKDLTTQLLNIPETGLKYVLQTNIHNETTLRVLGRIFGKDAGQRCIYEEEDSRPPPRSWSSKRTLWPGKIFGMDTEEGQAPLNTPNGCGVALMLAQHKGTLGHKVVDKVHMFYMVHEIEDYGAYDHVTLLFVAKDVETLEEHEEEYEEEWKEQREKQTCQQSSQSSHASLM
jgi:hypothetical protein